ncbi:MAG: SGNH/GDSL hydrolase family protein [Phormidesmis sp. RL_2_1]|nr:SGNH/GDSL hydrolase family protein [Phormidesmis sp. RL_2_1]
MVTYQNFLARVAVGLSSAAIAPMVIFQTALPVEAASFSQIYAFGDSLVDTGNAFALTGIPPAEIPGLPGIPAYFDGNFANGPIWTEYLARDLGIPETSFGYGGAFTSEVGALSANDQFIAFVPGTLAQVNSFLARSPIVDENALYVIWAGANDYLAGQQQNPFIPVNNIGSAVSSLSTAGAKNFLLLNLPDIGKLPLIGLRGEPQPVVDGLNALSAAHNQALAAKVMDLNAPGNIKVDLLDANSLIRSAMDGNQGFSNTTDACLLTPSCFFDLNERDSYLFWDAIHPSTQAHRIVADNALTLLHPQSKSVPEPATILGLMMIGGLALSQLKQKFA